MTIAPVSNTSGLPRPKPVHISLIFLLLLACVLPPPVCPLTSSLLSRSTSFLAQPTPASQCPHIVLFSGARHGSTWFVDAVDNCRYSVSSYIEQTVDTDDSDNDRMQQQRDTYSPEVFSHTEPWSKHDGPLQSISPAAAAEYVLRNASVKLLPPLAIDSPRLVRSFFSALKEQGVPVVVLRRNLTDAWASLREVGETGNWNVIKRKGRRRSSGGMGSGDQEGIKYVQDMEEYFEIGQAMLEEAGLAFDEIWYEDVVEQERISLQNAKCYIRNCNFL